MAGDVRGLNWLYVASTRRRSVAIAAGKWFSYAALTGVLLSPGLWFGPVFDAAAFMLVGSGIRSGGMPYRDYWDDKPPGLYLLDALSQAVLPWLDRWLVCWLLTLALTVGAAIILESLLRPRVGAAMAWIAALVSTFFVACYPVALGGGYGESFALPFVLTAVWLLSRTERRLREVALTGLLLSVGCLLSVQAAPAAVAIGLAAVVGKEIRGTTRRMISLVAAGVVLPLLAVGWLVWGGAAAQAYDLLVRYNTAFYIQNGQSTFWLNLLIAVVLLAALWPALAAQVVWWSRKRDRIDRVAAACVAWSLASLASFVYDQRLFLHYLILLVPALVVIAAPAYTRLWSRLRHSEAVLRWIAVVAQGITLAMLLTALVVTVQWPGSTYAITTAWHTDEMAVSSWIRVNTTVSATVFVWGDHPEIYLDSDRSPACPYIYLDPMTTQGYWSPQATAELVARWQSNPPAVVVETPSVVPLFRPASSSAGDNRTYDTLDPLRAFVRSNYRLAYSEGQADVWVKK
ncbi:MAG TPA: hypothetical protein VGE81_02395 [Candidatus Limnocylindrales bacterium]